MAPKKPSGGTVNPPTPWIGSAIMQATSPAVVVVDHVAQVVDAGLDVVGVVEVAERAAAAGSRRARSCTLNGLRLRRATSRGCR